MLLYNTNSRQTHPSTCILNANFMKSYSNNMSLILPLQFLPYINTNNIMSKLVYAILRSALTSPQPLLYLFSFTRVNIRALSYLSSTLYQGSHFLSYVLQSVPMPVCPSCGSIYERLALRLYSLRYVSVVTFTANNHMSGLCVCFVICKS